MRFIHSTEMMEDYPDNYTCIIGNIENFHLQAIVNATKIYLNRISDNFEIIQDSIYKWRQVFIKMGVKKKYISSLESLYIYFQRNQKLYEISPMVDFCNAYSLCNGLSMGAFDRESIRGNICLRKTKSSDIFSPLGNPLLKITPKSNEIVYADYEKVICRCWNCQDADETKISDDTNSAIIIVDLMNTGFLRAEDLYHRLIEDFQFLFIGDLFFGITGKNASSELEF